MLNLKILAPDSTVNYITNPALRYDTTGWNQQGATITRILSKARFGIASLQVVTTGSALHEGCFFRVSSLIGVSEAITVSVYVLGTGRVRIRLDNNAPGGAEYVSQPVSLNATRWTRLEASGFNNGGNDLRLYIETDEGTAKARTFYVDGAQLERKAYSTTYCDGDQPGCRWNGLYHGSTSQRSADTRAGGRWVQLAGKEREAEDLYMTVVGGLGVAPVNNIIQNLALEPGGYFQGKKVTVRPITLTFHAKHHIDDRDEPVSLAYLHELRQKLIDILKPDLTPGNEAIWFSYEDGNYPMLFQARYDGGLDGSWDIRNQFINSFPVRLLATDPFLYEDQQMQQALDVQEAFSVNNAMGRINGVWSALNFGVSDDIYAFARGPRGEIYAVGEFETINNSASAIAPQQAGRVAYWDGEKWVAIATVSNAGTNFILDIGIAANGYVYIVGSFTSINGVAAANIAYWDGSTWHAMGSGLNNTGRSLCVAPNGVDIYIGGDFTSANGITCNRITRWDGTKFNVLGQYNGLNNGVRTVVIEATGHTLYVGGTFSDQNGNPGDVLNRVAQYDIATGLFSAMGAGLGVDINDHVDILAVARSGLVYAGGRIDYSDTEAVNGIAAWNGSAWKALGSGFSYLESGPDAAVSGLALFSDDTLLATGFFTESGAIPCFGIGVWNGSTWTPFDIYSGTNFSGSDYPYTVLIDAFTDDIFIGFLQNSSSLYMQVPGVTTLENPGSAEVRPWAYFKGAGIVQWLENQSTGKRLFLNLVLAVNEEVLIDFSKASITSNLRGSLLDVVLPGSDFRAFTLQPNDNIIACLMQHDVGALALMGLTPVHWSVDATQRGEAF